MAATVQIEEKYIKALSLFTAKIDIRYYINGIYVVVGEDAVRLAATDGHTMMLAHIPHNAKEPKPEPMSVIVPNDAIRLALAAKKPKATIRKYTLEATDEPLMFTLSSGPMAIRFKAIDGKFPDYERALPRKCSGEAACFNTQYLDRFRLAAAICKGPRSAHVYFEMNGQGPALVHGIDDQIIGVVMPVRNDIDTRGLPSWIKLPDPEQKPESVMEPA